MNEETLRDYELIGSFVPSLILNPMWLQGFGTELEVGQNRKCCTNIRQCGFISPLALVQFIYLPHVSKTLGTLH